MLRQEKSGRVLAVLTLLLCVALTNPAHNLHANENSSSSPKSGMVKKSANKSANTAPAKLSISFATPQQLKDPSSIYEYAEDSPHKVELAVTVSADVSDFRFLRISIKDYVDNKAIYEMSERPYVMDTLSANNTLILSMVFEGDMPTRGISFTNRDGKTQYSWIGLSGEDGSGTLGDFVPPAHP